MSLSVNPVRRANASVAPAACAQLSYGDQLTDRGSAPQPSRRSDDT